jgi:hypothetical protein
MTPFKLSAERLAEIRGTGSEIDVNIDRMNLPEPQYGETVIGQLTDEETFLFCWYYDLQLEVEDRERIAMGEMLSKVGGFIRASDRTKSIRESIDTDQLTFGTEEEEKAFARATQLVAYIKGMLFFLVGERLACHEYTLGVRSRGRVVKLGRRLDPKNNPIIQAE